MMTRCNSLIMVTHLPFKIWIVLSFIVRGKRMKTKKMSKPRASMVLDSWLHMS
jgi:hypothetical protein